ncbi:mitochondrial inner membrane protease subunit 1 [Asbolus verrucosus]|uniref:Mitochondrial inner membrane protease subunit n=1 Tax=Asbolus verrucosus TaxID=1661398 RepID=A0A482VMI4_ASBVE|nr:mitochondrial inner membrane protease subunit 1 [Asbolus verrucosus]
MKKILLKVFGSVGYVVQYACLAHCTFEYIGDFVLCAGPSMEPTIYSDDILLTEHISPRFSRIDRGHIVIAKCPSNPKQHICKRVKGLPGDKIKTGFNSYEIVPRGHVWLEGDNSSNSADSRSYGPVPQGLIRSRALCRVWPLKDMKLLTN